MHIDQVTKSVCIFPFYYNKIHYIHPLYFQSNKRHYTKKDEVPGTSKIVGGRQCKVCKKQSTSQWRRGPDGSSKYSSK